jgi:ribosomal protein S18 acetylase RimI-like enzyme
MKKVSENLEIRKADSNDAGKIIEITRNSVCDLYRYDSKTLDVIKKHMENFDFFIMEKNKKPLGYMKFNKRFLHDGAKISEIYIKNEFQGKGLGSLMLRKAEELTKKLGKKKLYLYCSQKNLNAIKFYTEHKFYVVGLVTNYYINGETALLMCKEV